MKKIFSVIFSLVVVASFYSVFQISNAFSSDIPKFDESEEIVKEEKIDDSSKIKNTEKNIEEQQNQKSIDENKKVSTNTNNTQSNKNEKINKETDNKQDVNIESPKEESKQEVIQNQTTQVQTVQEQVITQTPQSNQIKYDIYKVGGYPKEYISWDECKTSSIDVAFDTDSRTMCYEAYTNSQGQKVYYIQIIYD